MPTKLDGLMDEAIATLTGPGGMFATEPVERWGTSLPVIAAAPPSLAAYLAHYCKIHHELEFLVSGDERLTFGAVYQAARHVAHALVGAVSYEAIG